MTIFLDRDGIINRKRPEGDYVKSWEDFEFLPGALEGLSLLSSRASRLIVVTNQRGISRGRLSERDLEDIHGKMLAAIRWAGGRIDAIYYCPHEEGACDCRKPRTGLFHKAKLDFPEIEFTDSVLVGDSLSDLEAAFRLSCRAVLIAPPDRQVVILEQARETGIPVNFSLLSLLEFSRADVR